jgi:hypothetical protein
VNNLDVRGKTLGYQLPLLFKAGAYLLRRWLA